MDELSYVYATAAVAFLYFAVAVARRRFDPFAPVWLFLIGYVQVYVVQAISYHEYAIARPRAGGDHPDQQPGPLGDLLVPRDLLAARRPRGRRAGSAGAGGVVAGRARTCWSRS